MDFFSPKSSKEVAIVVAIIATESEGDYLRKRLDEILKARAICTRPADFKTLIVYQCTNPHSVDVSDLEGQNEILFTDNFSASAARNLAIDWAHENSMSHVILKDVRVRITESFFLAAEAAVKIGQPIVRCGRLAWSQADDGSPGGTPPLPIAYDVEPYDPIRESYIGQFIFEMDALRSSRFNEQIGPGKSTRLKSGEDVQFILDVLNKVGTHHLMTVSSDASLFRRSRPADMSKQVAYAEGQGALYRSLLRNWRSWNPKLRVLIAKNFILFAGNALVRLLLCRPRSVEIAKLRLKGFLSN